jgi:peptidoglycan/xylan/chitin deacetylase (PgdA/CDA1 family)
MDASTPPDYLLTPLRRHGAMDHDFYPWRDTWAAPRLYWPEGQALGIWLQVAVEWFPLNIGDRPFLPVGAPYRPWPDTQVYTQRDHGLRIGIFRVMDALAARGLPASALLNARVAERYPVLMRHILEAGWDIVAAGLDAGALHHEGLPADTERTMIAETLAILRRFGVTPTAWHSPSWSQSTRTPALLVEAGLKAMVDWPNDDAPYPFQTPAGPILSLPTSMDLSDREMLALRKQPLQSWEDSVVAAARCLLHEAHDSGHARLLTLNVSPWLVGQPYRIAAFERVLDRLFALDGTLAVDTAAVIAAHQAALGMACPPPTR